MSPWQFGRRAVAFASLLATAYLALLFVVVNSPRIRFPETNLWTNQTRKSMLGKPTVLMVRELGVARDLDILFTGSSHAYRTFDPRFFDTKNLRTFNMGTTGQTPVNTYFLMRDHFDQVRAPLVVIETYPDIFRLDGTFSSIDLIQNTAWSWSTVRMVLATKSLPALNALLFDALDLHRVPVDQIEPRLDPGDTYVGRGYVEKRSDVTWEQRAPTRSIAINHTQLRYLRRTIEWLRRRGSRVLCIVQPIPEPTRRAIKNYAEVSETIRATVTLAGAEYVDFNGMIDLTPGTDFYDYHHMRQSAVEKFLPVFYAELVARGLIPEPREAAGTTP